MYSPEFGAIQIWELISAEKLFRAMRLDERENLEGECRQRRDGVLGLICGVIWTLDLIKNAKAERKFS